MEIENRKRRRDGRRREPVSRAPPSRSAPGFPESRFGRDGDPDSAGKSLIDYLKEYFDFKAFFLCLALVGMGLVSVYSATYDAGAAATFDRQLIWAGGGFVFLLVVGFFPIKPLKRIG